MSRDYSWLDEYKGLYASCLNEKIRIGISVNTESIHRTKWMKEGLVITWIISGNGVMKTEKGTFPLSGGKVMVRHPRLDFNLTLFSQCMHRRCYLVIPESIFDILVDLHPEILDVPPVFDMEDNLVILEEFLHLAALIDEAGNQNIFTLLPHIERFVLKMLSPCMGSSRLNMLRNAKDILSSDFSSPLKDIAERVGMSYNTFRKAFVEQYSMSPSQFRIKARCMKAKELLSIGYTCTEVADQLEYPDLYSFSHQFSTVIGKSPKDYRKSHIL